MAQQADDHVDVRCQISDEAVAADLTDTTMFGTTSSLSFSGLVENVPIDAVVKVMYNTKSRMLAILLSSDTMVSKYVAACRF